MRRRRRRVCGGSRDAPPPSRRQPGAAAGPLGTHGCRDRARGRGPGSSSSSRSSPPRAPSRPAVGALSALAVVAVVLVATALSGGFLGDHGIALASSHPGESPGRQPARRADRHRRGRRRGPLARRPIDNGAFAYNVANVDAVCPLDRQPDCAPFADGHARPVTLTAIPKFVFQSPVDDQAVVVGTDAAGADAVIVVALPTPEPSILPTAERADPRPGSPVPSVATPRWNRRRHRRRAPTPSRPSPPQTPT